MTLRSRKKHRTTRSLGWASIDQAANWARRWSAGLVLAVAWASADGPAEIDSIDIPVAEESRSLPDLREMPTTVDLPQVTPPTADEFQADHRAIVNELMEASARLQEPGDRPTLVDPEDRTLVYRVNTAPPSRERLFRVLSQDEYLLQLEKDYRQAGQTGAFYLPAPVDRFNNADSNLLSPNWFQSSATGVEDQVERRRGTIATKGGKAYQEVGRDSEVAIINETVGSPDMRVEVKIELGGPKSNAGLVVRAMEPRRWTDAVDQIEVNRYHYVLFGMSSVALYFHEPGKEDDLLIKSADVAPPAGSFLAAVSVAGNQFRVYRDGQEILAAVDTAAATQPPGEYCGIIAGVTEDRATTFDDFLSTRYGGDFVARSFGPSAAIYRGANVHYHPLYFEQIALERYGQHFGNMFAPWIAHALFFADAALLPYSLGKSPPWHCHSDICLYEPGDVIPFRLYLPVADKKGAFLQATAIALTFSVLP
jgi:hypothetical protein